MSLAHLRSLAAPAFAIAALVVCAAQMPMPTPTVEQFDTQVHDLEPALPSAMSDPARAIALVPRLDEAQRTFAALAAVSPRTPPSIELYRRLDRAIRSIHERYRKIADDCDLHQGSGGMQHCSQAREVVMRSAYVLGWLDFQAASTIYFNNDPARAKLLLEEAVALFTRSADGTGEQDVRRDNLLGRAFAERERGRSDRREYDKAISDFKLIMKDGPEVNQYKAARQGCATTYYAMGEIEMDCTGGHTTLPFHGPIRRRADVQISNPLRCNVCRDG